MLPAPATIATPPRARSRVSWNPAVPPPPVAGAAVGKVLADGLGVGEGECDGERVGVGDPPGERDGGVADGVDPVQAETDTEASMVTAAQLRAVNLALSLVPAMVVRISTGPPSCLRQMAGPFPVLA